MFFIMSVSSAVKELNFIQTMTCSQCEHFGRFHVMMTYTYLSFFFIPVLKWGKKYYVKTSCCSTTYSIDSTLGKSIERGQTVTLTEDDLHIVKDETNTDRKCSSCGYPISDLFSYCPKCGEKV